MKSHPDAALWLPFPPSVNNLFPSAIVKGRIRRFPSKAYRLWRKEAEVRVMAARIKRFELPVVVSLELTPRDSRGRDADNYCKAIMDTLVKMRVLHDDSNRWVKAITPFWMEPNFKEPGVVVRIRLARIEVGQLPLPGVFDAPQDLEAAG